MVSDTNGTAAAGQNGTAANGTVANDTPEPRIKICVYCGASSGKNEAHLKMARELAQAMATAGACLGEFTALCYGGLAASYAALPSVPSRHSS